MSLIKYSSHEADLVVCELLSSRATLSKPIFHLLFFIYFFMLCFKVYFKKKIIYIFLKETLIHFPVIDFLHTSFLSNAFSVAVVHHFVPSHSSYAILLCQFHKPFFSYTLFSSISILLHLFFLSNLMLPSLF